MNLQYSLAVCGIILYFSVYLVTSADVEDEEDYEEYEDFTDLNSTTNGTLRFIKELANITRDSGKTVKLRCEVKNLDVNGTGNKVKFTWIKNHASVEEDKRIKITAVEKPKAQIYISRLKIYNLEFLDQGFYACLATNGVDKIVSQGVLEVSKEKWVSSEGDIPTFRPAYDDTKAHSFDGGVGVMTTFFPNSEMKGRDESFISTITNPILPTLSEQTVNNPVMFDTALNEKIHVSNNPLYNGSEAFCQIYSGTICKDLLEHKYVFIQPPYTQRNIEEKLANAFVVISQSNDISSSCSKFAVPSLCFSAFPLCINPKEINVYQEKVVNRNKTLMGKDKTAFSEMRNVLSVSLQRICKEDCEQLENELCRREYAIAKRHPVIGQTLELEQCEFLPNETESNALFCLRLGVERAQNVNEDDNCFWDDGALYRGVQDFSIANNKCIRWSHQFHIPLSEHPELSGHAYCRNPGSKEAEPFCYVEQTRKEICGLPKCANIIWFYITSTVVAFVAVIMGFTIYFCCKRSKARKTTLQNMNVPTVDKNIYGNTGPNSPMEMNTLLPNRMNSLPPTRTQSGHKNNYQNLPHYTYKELKFVEELGEGAFGKVYKGELKTKNGKLVVAVKSLKENASAKTQADFQREIELISELRHPNIICLLGVVVKHEPMCMLFEFMSEGDLHEFLITNSPNEGKNLSQTQFLHVAIQIAQGMEYLSENHYVHRDLAARNCLVSGDLVVKISDFGLSRDMYSCDYYRVQSKSLLPVRWMPPESILYGKFTTESDVWSYGVVLWEIYSYGLQPYYGYNNQEVISMIRSRKLLPCPDSCPSYCYALMIECWAELALRRPSFNEIVHRLKVWKQNGSTSGAYFKTPEVHTNIQKPSSRSSHTSDSQTVICPSFENQPNPAPPHTWERNLKKASSSKLNESQSSLASHASSLGNRTQSTSLSNDQNVRHSRKSVDNRKSQKSLKNDGSLDRSNAKNTVVSSNGDSFETKLTF